jgi:hypothetical protein
LEQGFTVFDSLVGPLFVESPPKDGFFASVMMAHEIFVDASCIPPSLYMQQDGLRMHFVAAVQFRSVESMRNCIRMPTTTTFL